MQSLNIDLGERSYDILLGSGLLGSVGKFLSQVLQPSRIVLITHPSLFKLYGEKVLSGFKDQGWTTDVIEVPEGETSKTLQQAEKIFDRLLDLRCDRKTVLVALGGGVIGDLVGFVAATYQRGIPFVQVPTTLLSQVDSSVGGKTAVNHPKGKNMIGAFYQPRLVVADLGTLQTLPKNEFRAGLAEVIKYGVISDPSLFEYLEKNTEKILQLDNECLAHIVKTSCAIKAEVVEKDERESHYRMILNFGHTLGHAFEALTGYSRFIHGEAVAIGMVHAAKLSQQLGKCQEEITKRLSELVRKCGLPIDMPDLDPQTIIDSLYHDKKTMNNKIKFILVKEIGVIEIVDDLPKEDILKMLHTQV
ncbi:MAG: 3-dehydroquinate synthase [Nitrospina sp.]|jgi:3-dehydroquinate synthase|nr:3-dehydroquinate synthase [Nitrospina sp.]